ncbi:ABC transporter permease [Nocardiopsis terrae]|uniref:ATP-binding cassette subfamily B protein n=1 Tax=Nocardiopsis terrae TaxID=372655 RepID=A0ABR9HHW6_9ACTN|nr:ABC transporter ATP-binding protein [Nocardiopsis terrae]MBE1458622.1 ATP-binding cassette subfamily B protein [Nocardiopsis terrae]GHC79425.1 ABC transporter permease [Nocardiopsis terrae]
MPTDDHPLPSSWRALARTLRLGWAASPGLIAVAFATTVGAALPDVLIAAVLAMLTEAVVSGGPVDMVTASVLLGALAALSWLLRVVSERANRRFADRAAVFMEAHVVRLQSGIPSLEHHERPAYVNRAQLLRDHADTLSEVYQYLFQAIGALLRLGLTMALLMAIHPLLGLLCLFAVPTALVSHWRGGVEHALEERTGHHERLARHFFLLGTRASPGRELRVSRTRERVRAGRSQAWAARHRAMSRARWTTTAWRAAALAVFGGAFMGSLAWVALGGGSAAEVVLLLSAGSRLAQYIGQTLNQVHFLRTIWLEGGRRLLWLEELSRASAASGPVPPPERMRSGITLEGVSFGYPGTDRPVLDEVTLHLPAGAVVAVVGENGAGKSTLVKLLAKMYEPDSGRILVDDVPLADMSAEAWRARLSGAFQDFARLEYPLRLSIGLGDLPRAEDGEAVGRAVERADARTLVEGLDRGLDTQLGNTWAQGAELSEGQWQKVALARGYMRDHPLLLLLDEPASALDAETEHLLFEQYAERARALRDRDHITLLVSHRFSTVRMADHIVVMDGARICEQGTHAELMELGGRYAELYGIQARAYRVER